MPMRRLCKPFSLSGSDSRPRAVRAVLLKAACAGKSTVDSAATARVRPRGRPLAQRQRLLYYQRLRRLLGQASHDNSDFFYCD